MASSARPVRALRLRECAERRGVERDGPTCGASDAGRSVSASIGTVPGVRLDAFPSYLSCPSTHYKSLTMAVKRPVMAIRVPTFHLIRLALIPAPRPSLGARPHRRGLTGFLRRSLGALRVIGRKRGRRREEIERRAIRSWCGALTSCARPLEEGGQRGTDLRHPARRRNDWV